MRRVETVSVAESVAADLRRKLLAGEFAPGTLLADVHLCAEYGVARPTIRVAIQQLVAEGMLVREPGRSARVPILSENDVEELFFVRLALERAAVAALTRRAGRPEQLERVVARLEAFDEYADWAEEIAETDMEFHRALIHAVGNRRLTRVYGDIQAEIRVCLAQLDDAYESPRELAAEHRRLLQAIDHGDEGIAVAVVEEHLRKGLEDLTRLLRERRGRG